jgi:hypothetical protein
VLCEILLCVADSVRILESHVAIKKVISAAIANVWESPAADVANL